MLKKRIIPIQLLLDGRLVKSVGFDNFRDVGDPVASSRVYNSQYADELIFLNISRNNRSIKPLITLIEEVSEVCFMPLTFGGGISSFEDAAALIKNGADKVVLNSICYQAPEIINKIAEKFGSQAVVAAIDVRKDPSTQEYHLFSNCGTNRQAISLKEHLNRCVSAGAGEVFIQSIDCDGSMAGFDIALITEISRLSTVPVIAAGGSGNYYHLKDAFLEGRIDAVACGSIFNFSDSNLIRAKAFLQNYQLEFKQI